jgi:hypothetical protein
MSAGKGEELMRIVLPLIALMLTTGAAAQSGAPQAVPPEPVPGTLTTRTDQAAVCRDRIELVRQERGLPKLQRDTASPDEALLIAAVDKRIGGCSVMVMRNNLSDVRPIPAPQGEGRMQRIR